MQTFNKINLLIPVVSGALSSVSLDNSVLQVCDGDIAFVMTADDTGGGSAAAPGAAAAPTGGGGGRDGEAEGEGAGEGDGEGERRDGLRVMVDTVWLGDFGGSGLLEFPTSSVLVTSTCEYFSWKKRFNNKRMIVDFGMNVCHNSLDLPQNAPGSEETIVPH